MCVRTVKLRDNRNPPFRRLSGALSVAIGTYQDDGGFVEHFFLFTKTVIIRFAYISKCTVQASNYSGYCA